MFRPILFLAITSMVLAACGSSPTADGEGMTVVATTSVLGDIVKTIVDGDAEVEVLMGPGADPHEFAPSSSQAALLRSADLVVANGLSLESGMVDVLEAAKADGANVLELAPLVDPIEFGGHDHGDHDEADHDEADHDEAEHDEADHDEADHDEADHDEADHDEAEHDEAEHDEAEHDEAEHDEAEHDEAEHDEAEHEDEGHHDEAEHEDEDSHQHGDLDPHFWLDPLRVAQAADLIGQALNEVSESDDWSDPAADYRASLEELHDRITQELESIDDDRRKLVTNHDALGYFADRYDFEVVATIIPGGSTLAEPGAAELAELAELLRDEGINAIFAETSSPSALADAVAGELGGEVTVFDLYTESPGEPGSGADTYITMMEANADTLVEALGG